MCEKQFAVMMETSHPGMGSRKSLPGYVGLHAELSLLIDVDVLPSMDCVWRSP